MGKMLLLAFTLTASVGVYLDLFLADSISHTLRHISYYTLQTNLIIAILGCIKLYFVVTNKKEVKWLRYLFTGATLWIMVTSIVYIVFLSFIHNPKGISVISNVLNHYLTPFLVLVYFVFYMEGIKPSGSTRALFVSYPLAYSIVTLIRGHYTGAYPYWFLNPNAPILGREGSYLYVIAFLVIGCIIFLNLGQALLRFKMRKAGKDRN